MKTNNRVDKIAKRVFSEDTMESTNYDFTDYIMSKIIEAKLVNSIVIEPLFSKKTWYIIIAIIVTIVSLTFIFIPDNNEFPIANTLNNYGFHKLLFPNIEFTFKSINISTTSFYSIISAGFLFIIQLIIIDKKNQQQNSI